MSNLEEALNKLEAGIKVIFEGSLSQFLPNTDIVGLLSEHLAESFIQNTNNNENNSHIYVIQMSQEITEVINASPEMINQLTDALIRAGSKANITFKEPPEIRIVANSDLKPDELKVITTNDFDEIPQTIGVEITSNVFGESVPDNAFLIVNGTEFYPLTRTVVNIGRREDNNLIINDQRISRLHAQIRLINGSFVIFDLDSAGGTMVNNININKAVLHPGDVISLAGVPIVFGQENTLPDETQDLTIE